MSAYHIMFLVLLFLSLLELSRFSFSKRIVQSVYVIIFLLLVLIYGQGSDYFNYLYLIQVGAESFAKFLLYNDFSFVNKEIGFEAIAYVWLRVFKLSPELLIASLSGLAYILFSKFILKRSGLPILSLFIYYCVFFLIYPFSAIRQAICISIFLCYSVNHLYERRYIKYYAICTLLLLVHYSSIVLFLLPLVNLFKTYKLSSVWICFGISLLLGVTFHLYIFDLLSNFTIIREKIQHYSASSLDWTSFAFRLLLFVLIIPTYFIYKRQSFSDLLLKIYIFGFLLYTVLLTNSLLSSRITVVMRHCEIVLLADLLLYRIYKRRLVFSTYVFVVVLMTAVYVKNINSFILQGKYRRHINAFNYPYVSIFERDEIFEIRAVRGLYLEKFID